MSGSRETSGRWLPEYPDTKDNPVRARGGRERYRPHWQSASGARREESGPCVSVRGVGRRYEPLSGFCHRGGYPRWHLGVLTTGCQPDCKSGASALGVRVPPHPLATPLYLTLPRFRPGGLPSRSVGAAGVLAALSRLRSRVQVPYGPRTRFRTLMLRVGAGRRPGLAGAWCAAVCRKSPRSRSFQGFRIRRRLELRARKRSLTEAPGRKACIADVV